MTLILIQNTVCNFLLFAKTNTTESYAQLVTRINPAPVDAGLFFWFFEHPPRCILTMKQRETNEPNPGVHPDGHTHPRQALQMDGERG